MMVEARWPGRRVYPHTPVRNASVINISHEARLAQTQGELSLATFSFFARRPPHSWAIITTRGVRGGRPPELMEPSERANLADIFSSCNRICRAAKTDGSRSAG
eukprot:scaffold30707_cov93-Phaeocystis_antarctica.AAC.1